MKRLSMVAMALALVVVSGVAFAATFFGNDVPNRLVGTAQNDTLRGLGGADKLFGKGENDRLFGGRGADLLVGGADGDRLVGGSGNDVIRTRDSERDRVFADADDEDLTSSNREILRKAAGGENETEHGPNHD